jgi:hypothetical protein
VKFSQRQLIVLSGIVLLGIFGLKGCGSSSDYPPCVNVNGMAGLVVGAQQELGREDGQAGYCILPNSGGEKYYYSGR